MAGPCVDRVASGHYRVRGALTLDSVAALRDYDFASSEGASEIDLSGVERVDSAALALLLDWQRNARIHGRSLLYTHPPDRLLSLIDLYDLGGVLPFVAS